MAGSNGLDKLSYVQLLALQERVEEAIAAKRAEDAQATKDQLRAMAEKAGFDIKELFGKRGSPKGTGVAKYRNQKDSSQTWRVAVASPTGSSMRSRRVRSSTASKSEMLVATSVLWMRTAPRTTLATL